MKECDILKYIPYGRENAQSRYVIASAAGITERAFRNAIQQLNTRSEGALIIADQSRGGYFIPKFPEDEEYCMAYLGQMWSREKQERRKAYVMEKKIRHQMEQYREIPGQMVLELEEGEANG